VAAIACSRSCRDRYSVVEIFNKGGGMATMNFSVPDDVKAAFNRAYAGANKSAVVTELLRQAVEDRERLVRRRRAIDWLLRLRRTAPPATARDLRAARRAGRP
jgi:hypothetical protein